MKELTSGTQTCVIDTEHTLSNQTSAHVFGLMLDLNNLAGGDVLEVNVYVKAISSGTERLVEQAIYAHQQHVPIVYTPPIPSAHSVTFKIQQTDGTGRDVPWSLYQLD